jgi:hypothetical protein
MDKRSSGGVAGEWRKQALSGQARCRSSTGAALRAGDFFRERPSRKGAACFRSLVGRVSPKGVARPSRPPCVGLRDETANPTYGLAQTLPLQAA